MSRYHAEVRMTLEPRKITIRDTNSMHGTFVNGLQLHRSETAELQEGTEVTFGVEVTRGDDVFPAKTFRCEVKWERSKSPSPCPEKNLMEKMKTRTGYGVSSEELLVSEYESNEEDEFDHVADQVKHEKSLPSSGSSSPAASDPSSSDQDEITVSGPLWKHSDDIPESHERSTKHSFDSVDKPLRMPTIHSLMHKSQSDCGSLNTSPSAQKWSMGIARSENERIGKSSYFPQETIRFSAAECRIKDGKVIGDETQMDLDSDVRVVCISDSEDRQTQLKNGGIAQEAHEVSTRLMQLVKEENSFPDPLSRRDPNSKLSAAPWSSTNRFFAPREVPPLPSFIKPTSTPTNMTGGFHSHWSSSSQPISTFMESKKEFFDARAKNFEKVREMDVKINDHLCPTPPSLSLYPWSGSQTESQIGNINALDSKPVQMDDTPQTSPSNKRSGFMRIKFWSKSEEDNEKSESESSRNPPAEARKIIFGEPCKVLKSADNEGFGKQDDGNCGDVDGGEEEDEVETDEGEEEEIEEQDASNDIELDEGIAEDGDFDKSPKEQKDAKNMGMLIGDIFGSVTNVKTATTKDETSGPIKMGYNKFSIDDMMNHESLNISRAQEVAFETISAHDSDKSNPSTALQDTLDKPSLSTTVPTLKRKRCMNSRDKEVVDSTLVHSADHELDNSHTAQFATEVVIHNIGEYPGIAMKHVQANEQGYLEEDGEAGEENNRPSKKNKGQNHGSNFVKIATASVAGAIVGSVGMFAALVATAQ